MSAVPMKCACKQSGQPSLQSISPPCRYVVDAETMHGKKGVYSDMCPKSLDSF